MSLALLWYCTGYWCNGGNKHTEVHGGKDGSFRWQRKGGCPCRRHLYRAQHVQAMPSTRFLAWHLRLRSRPWMFALWESWWRLEAPFVLLCHSWYRHLDTFTYAPVLKAFSLEMPWQMHQDRGWLLEHLRAMNFEAIHRWSFTWLRKGGYPW